jgi:hypothetical protein
LAWKLSQPSVVLAGRPVMAKSNPVWAELVQLLPILSLAFPFIVQGRVDLARAGSGFFVGALLSLPITAIIQRTKHLHNPILVGTNLWLCLGVVAFDLPVAGLAAFMVATQAFGLFLAALLVGTLCTFFSPYGYVACRTDDRGWLRRHSLLLLGLTLGTVVWSWYFRADIRLGGGLPFIVLNVVRRLLVVRAPVPTSARSALN